MNDDRAARAPAPLLGAAGLVGLEGSVLTALTVLELLSLDTTRVALALSTALFFLSLAAGLGWCARGLVHLQSWARGPVVAGQLIALLLVVSFWGGSMTPVAVALLVVAVLTLVGVLHPDSTQALAAADEAG